MTTWTEQYTDIVKQSGEAARTAVDNWTKTVQQAMGQLPTAGAPFDVGSVVDEVFDLAEKMLETQRDLAKKLIATSTAASEAFFARATEAADAVTKATNGAASSARSTTWLLVTM